MTPKEMAILAAKALDSKKGGEVKIMEVTDLTSLADYFVICTGSSNTQINALCDAVEERPARSPCTERGTGAASGSCWTMGAWWSTCSTARPGNSTAWSGCGATENRWIWRKSWPRRSAGERAL